jgi:ankyrin repeat protein
VPAAELLLAKNALMETEGSHKLTALGMAVVRDQVDVARLLVQKGAKVDSIDSKGRTPLMIACVQGSAPLVELLLSSGADKDARAPDGLTPLMHAIAPDSAKALPVIKLLAQAGCDFTLKSKFNKTAGEMCKEGNRKDLLEAINQHIKDAKKKSKK